MAITKMSEHRCSQNVLYTYFQGGKKQCSADYINECIQQIMNAFPQQDIYIGITHHPCGRFSGDYGSFPVPASLGLMYESAVTLQQMLLEAPHYQNYDRMFVICCTEYEQIIRAHEAMAIAYGIAIDPVRIKNGSAGGEGDLSVAVGNLYFIYVCITKAVNG